MEPNAHVAGALCGIIVDDEWRRFGYARASIVKGDHRLPGGIDDAFDHSALRSGRPPK